MKHIAMHQQYSSSTVTVRNCWLGRHLCCDSSQDRVLATSTSPVQRFALQGRIVDESCTFNIVHGALTCLVGFAKAPRKRLAGGGDGNAVVSTCGGERAVEV